MPNSCKDKFGRNTMHRVSDLDYRDVEDGLIRCTACGGGYELSEKGWVQR